MWLLKSVKKTVFIIILSLLGDVSPGYSSDLSLAQLKSEEKWKRLVTQVCSNPGPSPSKTAISGQISMPSNVSLKLIQLSCSDRNGLFRCAGQLSLVTLFKTNDGDFQEGPQHFVPLIDTKPLKHGYSIDRQMVFEITDILIANFEAFIEINIYLFTLVMFPSRRTWQSFLISMTLRLLIGLLI